MKKGYTRIVSILCICSLLLTGGFALDVSSSPNISISPDEMETVSVAMRLRGMDGDICVEVLLDHNGIPAYIFGTTDSGYLILDRNSMKCMENGLVNPYAGYMEAVKYYGGPTLYYAEVKGQIYDITRGQATQQITYLSLYDEAVYPRNSTHSASTAGIVTFTEKRLRYAYDDIQRQAFGYNDDNTCTAVACAIVLNYLDRHSNDDIVNSHVEAENVLPASSAMEVKNNTPNAYGLHRFLVDNCGMGIATWGDWVTVGIGKYRDKNPGVIPTGLEVYYRENIVNNWAIDDIDDGRPSMLTSTLLGGSYKWHTMPIYGYRQYSDGTLEYLVHPGWYTRVTKDSATGQYYVPEVWVDCTTATFLYKFSNN